MGWSVRRGLTLGSLTMLGDATHHHAEARGGVDSSIEDLSTEGSSAWGKLDEGDEISWTSVWEPRDM